MNLVKWMYFLSLVGTLLCGCAQKAQSLGSSQVPADLPDGVYPVEWYQTEESLNMLYVKYIVATGEASLQEQRGRAEELIIDHLVATDATGALMRASRSAPYDPKTPPKKLVHYLNTFGTYSLSGDRKALVAGFIVWVEPGVPIGSVQYRLSPK
jgi:hypothetical protein